MLTSQYWPYNTNVQLQGVLVAHRPLSTATTRGSIWGTLVSPHQMREPPPVRWRDDSVEGFGTCLAAPPRTRCDISSAQVVFDGLPMRRWGKQPWIDAYLGCVWDLFFAVLLLVGPLWYPLWCLCVCHELLIWRCLNQTNLAKQKHKLWGRAVFKLLLTFHS